MPDFTSYCEAVASGKLSDLHKKYHDTAYGFPVENDNALFGKMLMEMNQAGLSWDIVLKKKDIIKAAYANFDIDTVAAFSEEMVDEMLQNPGIIRMRAKINAAISNAQKIQELQKEYGSYANWLDHHHPKPIEEWIKLFKKTFRFMGKETAKEFLMASGYLKGAHDHDCPIHQAIIKEKPRWLESA